MSLGALTGKQVGGFLDMNAILYENRSHYYYGTQIAALQIRVPALFLLILRSL